MNFKVVYMPGPDNDGPWFETETEAWDYILNLKCGFGAGELCEMCQAEYSVFSKKEIEEIEAESKE